MMKDKLQKHHKNPRYFIIRRVAIVLALALTLSLSIGIPLAIRAHSKVTNSNIVLVK